MMGTFLFKKFIKNYSDVKDPKVRDSYGKLAGAVGIKMCIRDSPYAILDVKTGQKDAGLKHSDYLGSLLALSLIHI